jgi:cellulose synthase/poly-beta-1,6-N-acetylglucosamine synthase-like glycosyltransferase
VVNKLPKVLIAAPTSERHKFCLNDWIGHLNKLTYPAFDVLLVDNTLNSEDYFNELKTQKVKDKEIIVQRHIWDPDKLNPLQMLAHVREEIRQFFLKGDYDYLFCLDDDIFIPKDGIQRLIYYNKDHVGFYTHLFYKPHRVPCILKSGEIIIGRGLDYFTFAEIKAYKRFAELFIKKKLTLDQRRLVPFIIKDKINPFLFKTYAVNLGCLLIKRSVLEKCEFRTHPTFIWGEDLWYYSEANDKKFEFWCDSGTRVEHRNTEWQSVLSQSKKQMGGFVIMRGPVDSTNFDLVNFSK